MPPTNLTTHAEGTPAFIDFGGRRVVVSGASSGLGRAVAVELSRRGAIPLLLGRDRTRLEETAQMLATRAFDLVSLDLRDTARILPTITELVKSGGRIYGFCHSAGVVETLPLNAIKPEGLRALLEVNVTSGVELARAISRRDYMTEDAGSIVFISSIYASVGMAGQIGYSATKGALLAASRTMAVELARRNIRVNTLSPGLVHTRMSDAALGRLDPVQTRQLEAAHPLGTGKPEDVARAAAFLLAPENRWITGTDLVVDGGYTAR